MKFKITKKVKIILLVIITLVILGFTSYKVYFEKLIIFKENEKMFLESVQNYFKINKTFTPKDGDYMTLTLQDMYDNALIDALHVPKKNKFCSEDNSFVRTINENGVIKYITYLECGSFKSKVDHTSPVIVLNGDKKVIVNLNNEYKDAGIKSVIDDYDGLIENSKVEIINNVDVTKPGNYKVIYKIYDSNFNMTKETRTVVVANTLNQIVKKDTNDVNYYQGDVENNYLLFSGMLFRIVKINDNGSVKIVSDDNISHVSYTESKYIDSNVRHWLNNYFLNNINENSKKYIVDGIWCVDNIPDINNFTCNTKVKDKIGLLNVEEYLKSKSKNISYLDGAYRSTLLINKKTEDKFYITQFLNQNFDSGVMYPSVRPSLNLKENTYVISGNGTYNNPYMIGDYQQGNENDLIKDRKIGEYVKYSGYLTRISNITEKGNVELIFMEELETKKVNGARETLKISINGIENYKFNLYQENNPGYILNNEYINHLLNNYLVEEDFNIPKIKNNVKYDEYETETITGKIFLPYTYQMFSSDYHRTNDIVSNYLYSDYSSIENNIFAANSINQVVFDAKPETFGMFTLRPVVYINGNIKINSGKGTSNKPYILK